MARNNKAIPAKVEKLIYQEAGSACPFCDESEVSALEVHHIDPRQNGGSNEPENLILTCASCHTKIQDNVITLSQVLKIKIGLQRRAIAPPRTKGASQTPSNVIQFNRSSNTGVVANTVNIRSPRRTVRLEPPTGTIAADRDKRNYAKYLIGRYFEFKKADHSIEQVNYPRFYKAIQRQFKGKWDFIPEERFDDLVSYLQSRIDKTILGKNQRARGHSTYRTFDDFLAGMK
jgi:hypothetical protein